MQSSRTGKHRATRYQSRTKACAARLVNIVSLFQTEFDWTSEGHSIVTKAHPAKCGSYRLFWRKLGEIRVSTRLWGSLDGWPLVGLLLSTRPVVRLRNGFFRLGRERVGGVGEDRRFGDVGGNEAIHGKRPPPRLASSFSSCHACSSTCQSKALPSHLISSWSFYPCHSLASFAALMLNPRSTRWWWRWPLGAGWCLGDTTNFTPYITRYITEQCHVCLCVAPGD